MLNENIKAIRKSKGISQEEMAVRLNVVRQTVSKWEKGYSVPDAEMLIKISDLFEVQVSDLLGEKLVNKAEQDEIAQQLARINEQLAIKNRRWRLVLKIILGAAIGLVVLYMIFIIIGVLAFSAFSSDKTINQITNSEIIMQN